MSAIIAMGLGAILGGWFCYRWGYVDGRQDRRLALSKPAKERRYESGPS